MQKSLQDRLGWIKTPLFPLIMLLFVACSCSSCRPSPETGRMSKLAPAASQTDRARTISPVSTSSRSPRPFLFQSDRDGDFEIYSMFPDGSELRKLTDNAVDDEYPSWSPDGSRILFHTRRDGIWQIAVMNAHGGDRLILTNGAGDHCSPAWTPDGTHILFDHRVKGKWVISRMKSDGSNQEIVVTSDGNYDSILSAPSPDGSSLAFTSNRGGQGWQIHVLDLKRLEIRQLTRGAGGCRPKWSPDSRKIAYVSTERDGKGDVWLMKRTGEEAACVTSSPDYDYHPTWSADGLKILFARAPDKRAGPWNLVLISLVDQRELLVTHDAWKNNHPAW